MAILEKIKENKEGAEYRLNIDWQKVAKGAGFGLVGYLFVHLLGWVGLIVALIIGLLGYAYKDKVKL